MFTKAERKKVYLKIGMMGPSGSGKTYSAILLAKGLAKTGKIAVIDTENGSASLYAHLTGFDVCNIEPPFNPKKCIEAIDNAVAAGYAVVVIDSTSHFWKDILARKEALDRAGGNSFVNWGKVKPMYELLKDKQSQSPIHLIACMRAKDEYVIESTSSGKQAPKKVGMGAINEPGAEYEYTTVFDLGMDHFAQASKDRTSMFDDEVFKIDAKTGERFLEWLNGGSGKLAKTEAKSA